MCADFIRIYVGTPRAETDDGLFVDLIVNGLCIPVPCKSSEYSLEENPVKALEAAFNVSKLLANRLHLKVSISGSDIDSLVEFMNEAEKKEMGLLLKELSNQIRKDGTDVS